MFESIEPETEPAKDLGINNNAFEALNRVYLDSEDENEVAKSMGLNLRTFKRLLKQAIVTLEKRFKK